MCLSILRKSKLNSDKEKQLYSAVKSITGFFPGKINLYDQALKHSSISKSQKESNERLEYLGDAILGSVVADYLFKKFPYKAQ